MAAGTLPGPGTQAGPCVLECRHEDCAETRRMAAAPCAVCGKRIGYDTRFYQRGDSGELVHAECVEQ